MGKSHKKKEKEILLSMTKKEERKTKKELKKQRNREKDYSTNEEKQFRAMLETLGIRIKFVDGDGNCMFRAISDQMAGDPNKHFDFRTVVTNYIDKNSEHFKLFIEDDEPYEDYICRMRQHGEWGGHQELYAASQCLKANIVVHQVDAPRFIIHSEVPSSREIHISYHGECHYNSVRAIADPDNGNPALHIHLLGQQNTSGKSPDISQVDDGPNAMEATIMRALPMSSLAAVRLALASTGDDMSEAIELLIADEDAECQNEMMCSSISSSLSTVIAVEPTSTPLVEAGKEAGASELGYFPGGISSDLPCAVASTAAGGDGSVDALKMSELSMTKITSPSSEGGREEKEKEEDGAASASSRVAKKESKKLVKVKRSQLGLSEKPMSKKDKRLAAKAASNSSKGIGTGTAAPGGSASSTESSRGSGRGGGGTIGAGGVVEIIL